MRESWEWCSVAGEAEGSQGDAHGRVEEKGGQSQGPDGKDVQGGRKCLGYSSIAVINAREKAVSSATGTMTWYENTMTWKRHDGLIIQMQI